MSIQPLLDPNNINNKSAIYYGYDITSDKLLTKTGDNAGYVNYKMPDLGSVGDIIQTDGSGNLFFTASPLPPASGIIYTGTLPLATGTHLKSNNPLGTTVNESIMIETANDISLQNGTISNCSGMTMTGTIAIGTNDITGTTGLIQGFNIPILNTTANTALSTANTALSTANSAQSTANTALTTANNALPLAGGTMTGNIDMGAKKITNCDDITANKFIVNGGTNIQYLLADGTLLTSSANSGNSNFYLYKSIDNAFSPPIGSGDVVYNNANQSLATVIYISHLTRDNVDIEVFFENVSSLNDLYIQDQNNNINYIRYNITGTPTIVPNDYILIPVILGTSGGTGSTSFGTNHNVLLSIFTNSIETDVRISNLEDKTQNQTAILNTTTFAGSLACSGLNMNTTKITNLATPTVGTDATNKLYVDSLIVAPTTISSVGTGLSLLGSGIAPNYTTKSLNVIGGGLSLGNSTSTDLVITSTALNTTGGTMTGAIAMNTNKITSTYIPSANDDLTNKLYIDSAITAIKQKGYPFNPMQTATIAIPTSSKSYFYTIIINRPLTISGFSVWLGAGSDQIRVGIFRGFVKASPISTATLVGQSVPITPTTSLPYTTGPINVISGQSLSFASGEYMTLGFSSNGTTNSFLTSPTFAAPGNIDLAFNGPVNYVNLGFTSTLQSTQQTSGLIYKICMELS
jgi:hypothetical protein